MPAEDWELRREARRCLYQASQVGTPSERRMWDGFARFYLALAESAGEGSTPSADKIPLSGKRDRGSKTRQFALVRSLAE